MAIAYVDSNSGTLSSAGTTVTVTFPSYSANDICLVAIGMRQAVMTLPSGWAVIGNGGTGAGALSQEMFTAYKIMDGTEGSSANFTFSLSAIYAWGAVTYSGVNAIVPFDVAGAKSWIQSPGSSAQDMRCGQLTTLTANTMLVYFAGVELPTSASWTAPSGFTERVDTAGINAVTIGDKAQATAGDTGSVVATASDSNTLRNLYGQLVALREPGQTSTTLYLHLDRDNTDTDANGTSWRYTTSGGWVDRATTGDVGHCSSAVRTAVEDGQFGYGLPVQANTGAFVNWSLTNVPDDFLVMTALDFRFSVVDYNTYADDKCAIVLNVYDSTDSYKLAGVIHSYQRIVGQGGDLDWTMAGAPSGGSYWGINAQHSGSSSDLSAPQFNKTYYTTTLSTYAQTATKSDWDGAVVRFGFGDERNMGGDGATLILTEFEIIGTYTRKPTYPPFPRRQSTLIRM